MDVKAVIFDLDGVIVSTDEYHYKAWKKIAEEQGIHFDREINERLRGVSRMESLDIILENANRNYEMNEKIELANIKNNYYRKLLDRLTVDDILPGVMRILKELMQKNIKVAIGSSSRNTSFILEKIRLQNYFDAVVDGNEIKRSKPDPEVFLLAAKKLELQPQECIVVEDADAGVEAALAGGMKVVGLGSAANNKKATYQVADLSVLDLKSII